MNKNNFLQELENNKIFLSLKNVFSKQTFLLNTTRKKCRFLFKWAHLNQQINFYSHIFHMASTMLMLLCHQKR